MTSIHFKAADGREVTVDVKDGMSVMQAAKGSDVEVDGVVAVCGGSMMCGTCHVFVDVAWTGRVGGPGEDEEAVLEILAGKTQVTEASRLSCQIKISPALEGLIVHLPKRQPGI